MPKGKAKEINEMNLSELLRTYEKVDNQINKLEKIKNDVAILINEKMPKIRIKKTDMPKSKKENKLKNKVNKQEK